MPWRFTGYTQFEASLFFTEISVAHRFSVSAGSLLSAESALRCRAVPPTSPLNFITPTSSVLSLDSLIKELNSVV
jgi:hypothetical protein